MTVENTNAEERVEELEIEVQEDAVVEAADQPAASSDEELDSYTFLYELLDESLA